MRTCYLLSNFERFPRMIARYESNWEIVVKAEKRYNSVSANGNLGVRVQKSGTSDPTMNEAISNIEIQQASSDTELRIMLKETDHPEEHLVEKLIIQDMQDDYAIILNAIHSLDKADAELFLSYLKKEKSVQEIAAKCNIQYSSAKRKVYDIRKSVIDTAVEDIKLKYSIIHQEVEDEQ